MPSNNLSSTEDEDAYLRELIAVAKDPKMETERLRLVLLDAVERLRAQRGRQLTFSALYETATEIIDVHDSSRVLEAAVHRARSLIKGDLGYLALYDEHSGGTRVTAGVGLRTVGFGSLHVPLGVGVGGKVSELRVPFATENYLTDRRMVHLSGVDDGIRAEGVMGMLGVPLIAHGDFLGALFVADRRVRHYSSDEIDRLQALAALMAVALDNARLFEREQASMKQQETAHQSLNARLRATEREALIHQRVGNVLSADGELRDLELIIREEFEGQASFVAERDHVATEGAREGHAFSKRVGSLPPLVLTVKINRPLVGSDRRVLERVAQAAETLVLRKKLSLVERGLAGRALFHRLSSGGLSVREAIDRGQALGLDLLKPCLVLALKSASYTADKLELFVLEALGTIPCLIGQADEFVITLLPQEVNLKTDEFQTRINRLVDGPVALGAAHCKEPVSNVTQAVREATAHAELVTSLGRAGQFSIDMQTTAQALLLRNVPPDEALAFVRASLGPLLEYDANRSGELIATVRAYFSNSMNATKAANELHIHAKTMVQRMNRISKLTHTEWDEAPQVLRMQIALVLHDIGAAAEGGAAVVRSS